MTFPNFIILGAAKAGTTALYAYLAQHPDVYVTPLKETNYFALRGQALNFRGPRDDDYVNRLSITQASDYARQFDGVQGEHAVGEASPLYLYDPRAAVRIRDDVPDVKLIALVRNPIDRAFSAFLHLVRDGREPFIDFRQGLAAESARIADNWEHIWHYTRMGFYYEQLKRYYDLFPPEQIQTFLYKDLRTQPAQVMRDILTFLGVDNTFLPDMTERHNATPPPGAGRPELLPETRASLQKVFRSDALRLQDLIGRDISHWLSDTPDALQSEAERFRDRGDGI